MIAKDRIDVRILVQLFLPFLQTSCCRSCYRLSQDGNTSVVLVSVLVTFLAEAQPAVQLVRYFLTLLVQAVKVVVIRVARFVVL